MYNSADNCVMSHIYLSEYSISNHVHQITSTAILAKQELTHKGTSLTTIQIVVRLEHAGHGLIYYIW